MTLLEKKAKAFDIISSKFVSMDDIWWYKTVEEYNARSIYKKKQFKDSKLTLEEFTLLKELVTKKC